MHVIRSCHRCFKFSLYARTRRLRAPVVGVYIIKLERRPVVYNQTDFCFLPFSKQFRLVYGILGIVVVKVYLKLKTHDYNQRANISCIFIYVVLFLTKHFCYGRPMEYGRPIYFRHVVSSFFFFPRYPQPSHIGCLPHFHTWCGLSVNLECTSEMCCTRLAGNAWPQKFTIWAPSHNFIRLYLCN